MKKTQHLQREIIYDSDSIVRTTNKNMGIRMEDISQHKYEYYHSHPDYQLVLLTKGSVDIVVADRIKKYKKGDILMLGCNLPHYLKANMVGEGFLIQFPAELFPLNIKEIPDYVFINPLLEIANGGLLFRSDKKFNAKGLFDKIHTSKGIDRICNLLQLLNRLGALIDNSETICYLNEEIDENPRMTVDKCKKYLRTNYKDNITLEQIATVANLNKTALCRAFRRETGETVFQYIIRLRIESSFKLLRNTNQGIAEIAYQCGFSSLPHFNKKFKEIVAISPSKYRSAIRQ